MDPVTMEMNSDFIAIQGLLKSLVKTTGDFTKIKYKGGNEMKINSVIKELEDYFTSKQYIDKRIPNPRFHKELDEITFFLVLNLDFNDKTITDIKEFVHLVNVIPTLSKCLLANIVIELGLNEYYCNALHKLPMEYSEELLSEIIPCIKKSKADICVKLMYLYMRNIITKVSSVDTTNRKMVEYIDKLEEVSCQILLNCSGINSEYMEGWKRIQIYGHMGHTLLCLLKLLLHCQVDNERLFKIIDDLINSICSLMNAVTVDVFCAWAELEHNNEVLQSLVAENAYHVLEKFQKHQPARPLIQMLGSIAKKPKSLNEMIQEANSATMIMRIDQNPLNRNSWFTALLNTQVFQNKETKECVKRWANLCTVGDMERLLSLAVNHKNQEDVVEIIMRCASFFSETELAIIITRYFHEYGVKNSLKSKNTLPQLTIFTNKLEKYASTDGNKDLLLLLLQDPELVLTELYKGCIKNDLLLASLNETFKLTSEIIKIEKLFLRALEKVIGIYKFDSNNIQNYVNLLRVLTVNNYEKLLNDFIIPNTQIYLDEERYEELNHIFRLHKEFSNKLTAEHFDGIIQTSVNILEKCRWKIFDFTNIKAALCDEAVRTLLKYKLLYFPCLFSDERIASLQHVLNKYYLTYLKSPVLINFLEFVSPHLDVENHAQSVGYLIKLLPICTTTEWYSVTKTLLDKCSSTETIELITDSLIIVTQVVETQIKNNNCVLNGLKFCMQNYGLIIKDIITPLNQQETNVSAAKGICRLLREMPKEIVGVEGLSLMSLISDDTLRELINDEVFLAILVSMKGSELSRIMAKKMLELRSST